MNPTSAVRFFSADSSEEMIELIDNFLRNNLNWEITSVSHTTIRNQVSTACTFKFIGNPESGPDLLET